MQTAVLLDLERKLSQCFKLLALLCLLLHAGRELSHAVSVTYCCSVQEARSARQLRPAVQAYSLFGGSDSKCPVARLVNGGKPAEALIQEQRLSPEAPRFQADDFNYAPFTAPSYQVLSQRLAGPLNQTQIRDHIGQQLHMQAAVAANNCLQAACTCSHAMLRGPVLYMYPAGQAFAMQLLADAHAFTQLYTSSQW